MTISATIILDSINSDGNRLTTMQLRYPRFIHSEFMTHRAFSRNASSSRAIPFKRQVEDLRREYAQPIVWGKNQPGMQAREDLSPEHACEAQLVWETAMEVAISYATELDNLGVHKQIVNRLIEPYTHINVLVSATEYDNFFLVRRHPDAQPEIHELADVMHEAMSLSEPTKLRDGEWHLPYITEQPGPGDEERFARVSVARCARVSYLTFEGKVSTMHEDIQLYRKLMGSDPVHASPTEHQAVADSQFNYKEDHGNFEGFRQFRKILGF